jgi:hypothetical protein
MVCEALGSPDGSTAEDQYLHQLLDDYAVGDSRPVAAERMVDLSIWGNRARNSSQVSSY